MIAKPNAGIYSSFRQDWHFPRPYVFVFLAVSLYVARQLLGWRRMFRLFGLTWPIARISVFSSTRAGIPFRGYVYSGSTEGRELYIFNIPFYGFPLFSIFVICQRLYGPCLWDSPWENGRVTRVAIRCKTGDSLGCCYATIFTLLMVRVWTPCGKIHSTGSYGPKITLVILITFWRGRTILTVHEALK